MFSPGLFAKIIKLKTHIEQYFRTLKNVAVPFSIPSVAQFQIDTMKGQ